jgi:broad specificity phosphatase PhoE|tara:strand:+ start:1026 stop:1670 length:645 start_codon:yes stop_codon:yes gene_type:complete
MLQILVRHGESVSNTEGRVQGQEDVALSQLGEAQAKALAQWSVKQFSKTREAIDEIWSSPLIRAQCTAVRIAEALGLPLSIDERLSELHAGIFQGHLWVDLEKKFPKALALWREGTMDYAIPGGESRAQLAERGCQVLESLASRAANRMIIVAHGGILTAALGRLVGKAHPLLASCAERPFTKLPALANCSVSFLEWPGPSLLSFNRTEHLKDL